MTCGAGAAGSSARLSRFTDWLPLQGAQHGVRAPAERPFFAGDAVTSRMDLVRHAISEIRLNWEQYPERMRELRELIERNGPVTGEVRSETALLERMFGSVKNWVDPQDPGGSLPDYSAIELYTSESGYQRIFRVINEAFRSDSLTSNRTELRAAAFLIELLTIDLYNYRSGHPSADNFEGVVYRGMCLTDDEWAMFRRIAGRPATGRYLAIPLALVSASQDRRSAIAFAVENSLRSGERRPVLWEIQVAGLDPDLLQAYQRRFPAGVVTSLCAVPIFELSPYQQEQEVLLRGPFFQLIRISETPDNVTGMPFRVIEAVMLNSNRDHLTTVASNEGSDRQARDMFRAMMGLQRARICSARSRELGNVADLATYAAAEAAAGRQLESLLAATPENPVAQDRG